MNSNKMNELDKFQINKPNKEIQINIETHENRYESQANLNNIVNANPKENTAYSVTTPKKSKRKKYARKDESEDINVRKDKSNKDELKSNKATSEPTNISQTKVNLTETELDESQTELSNQQHNQKESKQNENINEEK